MAIVFAEDFKGYGTTPALMLNGLYAQQYISLVTDPDVLATGNVLLSSLNGIDGTSLRRVFPANYTTVGVAFRLWLPQLPNIDGVSPSICLADVTNTAQIFVTVDTTGRLQVRLGSNYSTILATTVSPVIVANAWQHVEIKFVASAGSGTVDIRVNGVPVLAATALNTGLQYSQFRIESYIPVGTPLEYNFKDLVVWNNLGTSNNSFLGSVSVLGLVPSSDNSLGGWTVSTGTTGWNLLDNSPPLDSTEYIQAAYPAPAASSFNMTDLPVNVTSVRALITQIRARNIDGGDGNLQASVLSGAATGNGADRPMTSAFTYYEDLFEVDPNTSTTWTPSAVNAVKLKINRTL